MLYVDDLPNISQALFANYTDSEKQCIADVFDSIERSAIAATIGRLQLELQKKLGKARAEDRQISGRFSKTFRLIETGNFLCGKYIRTSGSDYLETFLESAQLYSTFTSGVQFDSKLYVFDTFDFSLLDTIDFTVTKEGIINIPINRTYNAKEGIFLAYDRRVIESRDIDYFHRNHCRYIYEEGLDYPCCNRNSSCSCYSCYCLEIATDFDPEVDALLFHPSCLNQSDCGMVVCYRTRCSFEQVICQNKELVCYALWYAFGIAIFNDKRISKQVNAFTHIDPEVRRDILDYFKDEFETHIKTIVGAIEADGYCFECKGTKIRNTLPG